MRPDSTTPENMNSASTTGSESKHEAEGGFVEAIRQMLARPDYLIPLAAAERQYRDHYYGLNAAALLEDLFCDALGNFSFQARPRDAFVRAPVGQKEWDYKFNGLKISHKVSEKTGPIAAIWDATKKGVTTWSFDEPITYVLASSQPPTHTTVTLPEGTPIACRATSSLPKPFKTDGRTILIVRWPARGSGEILDVIPTNQGDTVDTILPFNTLWPTVADEVAAGRPANEIEVLIINSASRSQHVNSELLRRLKSGTTEVSITVPLRGGIYFFSLDTLQDLEVTTNNRGILIPKDKVGELAETAHKKDNFVPLPLWYWLYAELRPTDMYQVQRTEYDALFSASHTPRHV